MCEVTSAMFNSMCSYGLLAARLLCLWGFSRQKYWNGFPFPSPGDRPNPGIDPGLLHCRWNLYHPSHQGSPHIAVFKMKWQGRLQDAGRIEQRDHLFHHKYIKRSSPCGTIPIEQLLNASRGPQMSREANQSPRNEVGQG